MCSRHYDTSPWGNNNASNNENGGAAAAIKRPAPNAEYDSRPLKRYSFSRA